MLAHGDGAPPAGVPLHLAVGQAVALQEVGVRGEPLRALPGAGLEELGTEGLLAREVGADAQVAAALPLLGRVDDAVGLVEVLRGAGPDVGVAALLGIETGHIRAMGVDDPRVAEGHPLGHHLGHAGAFLHPDGRRRPEVPHFGHLAQAGHGVGRQRQQAVDGVADLGVAQHVHQLDGLLHLLVEVIGRERHLGWRQGRLLVGGDVVGMVQDRPVGVGTDLHRAGRLALVAERVHVAHDGIADLVVGLGEHVDRTHIGHLMHRRHERDVGARHVGDPVGPHAAGNHHVVGLDRPLVGDHCRDRAHAGQRTFTGRDVEHLGVGEDLATGVDGHLPHPRAGFERVHDRDGGAVEAAQDHVGVDEGHQFTHLGGGEQMGLDAPGGRRGHAPLELVQTFGGSGHLDAPGVHREPQVPVLVGALLAQQAHLLVVVHREDEVGGMTRGAAGVRQGTLVQQHEVTPSELRQVPHQAVTDNPCSDDHAAGLGG